MSTTRVTRHIEASRSAVYNALIDPAAVEQWMVPEGMTSTIHSFEAREGGSFRISLTYDASTGTGKTDPQTDTFHGRFVELVPDTKVVQVIEFESEDPSMTGEMTITYTLSDDGGGTDLVGVHQGLPPGVRPEDNEVGWRMSLNKLAQLVR
ncbi:MAG: SRPBCC family protein [Acidimicrobiia bacterium]